MRLGSARASGFFWVLVTAVSWGLNWPAMKFALTEWSPFTFRVATYLGGIALLVAIGTLLVPIIGAMSAAALLHEPLGARELTALSATGLGIVLASRG